MYDLASPLEHQVVAEFFVAHAKLPWPWVAIDPTRTRIAFATSRLDVASRVVANGRIEDGPSFTLPQDLPLPTEPAPATGHGGPPDGVHGFAIDAAGSSLAVTGTAGGASFLVTLGADGGEVARTRVDALAGGDFIAHAVSFDRSGTRLWLSAESGAETALCLVAARTHQVLGVLRSARLPPPAAHELHVHPTDDAVLLLAACGQDGTFARVAGFTDGPPIAIPTAIDGGAISAGFVGFSADGARVHLAEADELRTHAWPGLVELSSVELADDFVSAYSGVVLGDRILVDGEDRDTGDADAVLQFDRTALRGVVLRPPVPSGMWVGRLGVDLLVTVEPKGDPSRGRVLRLPAPRH